MIRAGYVLFFIVCFAAGPLARAEADGAMRELSWEDLMPEGEPELLRELYAEFFDEFEKKFLAAQQVPLSQAAEAIDPTEFIEEGSAADTMPQIGTFNVVKELDGQLIRLPGYAVPLDFNKDHAYTEFLLVPYFGACLHSPPPPPNQIIYVRSETPVIVKNISMPVWVEGVMKTEKKESDIGNAAYRLALSKLELFELF